tara:strand:+ start:70 stop:471 length:402 start_codon:yes stop_codon:yes gene_type:complete
METKILKLTNGDEIITTLSNQKDGTVTAHNPLKINSLPKISRQGLEETMALSRWVSYGESEECDIIKNNIVAVASASVGISKFYEYCVTKMKKGSETFSVREPTDEQLERLENELDEELIDEYDDVNPSKTIH